MNRWIISVTVESHLWLNLLVELLNHICDCSLNHICMKSRIDESYLWLSNHICDSIYLSNCWITFVTDRWITFVWKVESLNHICDRDESLNHICDALFTHSHTHAHSHTMRCWIKFVTDPSYRTCDLCDMTHAGYGVATIIILLKIIGIFCRMSSLL